MSINSYTSHCAPCNADQTLMSKSCKPTTHSHWATERIHFRPSHRLPRNNDTNLPLVPAPATCPAPCSGRGERCPLSEAAHGYLVGVFADARGALDALQLLPHERLTLGVEASPGRELGRELSGDLWVDGVYF